LAAIQVTTGSPEWFMAKVITHDPQTGMYKLSDEDNETSKSKLLGLDAQFACLGRLRLRFTQRNFRLYFIF
jgi:hypothetical protein